MIDSQFKVRLTGKVATIMINAISETTDQELANSHLERLRRLYSDEQINVQNYIGGLKAVHNNKSLPDMVRENAQTEIDELLEVTGFEFNEKNGVTSSNILEGKEVSGSYSSTYDSAKVILPASVSLNEGSYTGWTEILGEDKKGFLTKINPIDGLFPARFNSTLCHWHNLPWYDNVSLIRITDASWNKNNLAFYFLTMGGNLYRLNGTSPPIHEVNAKAPIKLTPANAGDYFRFFCFFVRGDEGPFYVFERIDDPFIPEYETLSEDLKEIFQSITPLSLGGQNDDGHFNFEATIFYSNAIFKAKFLLKSSGMVEMLSDEPLAGDLRHRIDAPLSGNV